MGDAWLTAAEVAELLGVSRATVHTYRSRGVLPPPGRYVGATPQWRRQTVVWWQQTRPGRGYRTDRRNR